MKKIMIRTILIITIILTSSMIFGFSNQNAEQSSSISAKITKVITKNIKSIQEKEIDEKERIEQRIHSIIRKIAHYVIYIFLGIQIMFFISTYNINELDQISISLISGMIYSITDELHQAFIPGRAAQITDIMLDSLGVLTGIFMSLFLMKIVEIIYNISKNHLEKSSK